MPTIRSQRAQLRALPEEEPIDNSPETVAQRRDMFARMGWAVAPETPEATELVDTDTMVSTLVIAPETPKPEIVPADIPTAVAEPGIPYNAVTGANYTGKNVLRLITAECEHGYGPGGWAGFGQWKSAGRVVRKGEHGTGIVRIGAETVTAEDGSKTVGKTRPFGGRVFHFDQTTELVPKEES